MNCLKEIFIILYLNNYNILHKFVEKITIKMHKMKTLKHLCILMVLMLISIQLMAGWVITSERDEGFGSKKTETTYIQNDKFKTATEKDIVIFNFKTEIISLINPVNQSYWSGSLSDFKATVVEGMKSKMNNALENLPAEQRKMFEKMYMEINNKIEGKEVSSITDTEIKKTTDNLNIEGFSTDKYQLWQKGILREDVWIAEKLDISDEMNFEQFKLFFSSFTNIASERSVENSPEFFELIEKGYPLKTIKYFENFKMTTTAVKIEKKQIPDSEFTVPSGYKKINIMELWEND